jgi:hypothetical protein
MSEQPSFDILMSPRMWTIETEAIFLKTASLDELNGKCPTKWFSRHFDEG